MGEDCASVEYGDEAVNWVHATDKPLSPAIMQPCVTLSERITFLLVYQLHY
jgi:hypothetical protein